MCIVIKPCDEILYIRVATSVVKITKLILIYRAFRTTPTIDTHEAKKVIYFKFNMEYSLKSRKFSVKVCKIQIIIYSIKAIRLRRLLKQQYWIHFHTI